jgi:serine/threonine-protein kinase
MDRVSQTNQLLELIDSQSILMSLRQANPKEASKFEYIMQYKSQSLISSYELIEVIGKGGMGLVYRARHIHTEQLRAIKILKFAPITITEQDLERFRVEARLASQVKNRHVVEVVDAGFMDNGVPWIAMEYLEGVDLAAYVQKRGPLAVAELRQIVAELSEALAAAHRLNIIHRDLRPQNVFLVQGAGRAERQVKVLDFGLSKMMGERPGQFTANLGTPLWMAPEQMDSMQAVPANDVWALGLLAFFMLCGRHYFRHEASVREVIMRELLFDELEAASVRAEQSGCGPRIAQVAGFDHWFGRCVTRRLEERFPDADAAHRAFEALFLAGPVRAEPASPSSPPVQRSSVTGAGAKKGRRRPSRNGESGLFPLFGVTLGKTSVEKLAAIGTRAEEQQFNYYKINGYNFWYDSKRQLADSMHFTYSNEFPRKWLELGFNWDLSFSSWLLLLQRLGFKTQITKEPVAEGWFWKKFSAEIVAKKGKIIPIEIKLDFNYQEGESPKDPKTLYSISVRVAR